MVEIILGAIVTEMKVPICFHFYDINEGKRRTRLGMWDLFALVYI